MKALFAFLLIISTTAATAADADSTRIAMLQKKLQRSADQKKVDLLNDLAREFSYKINLFKGAEKDSMLKYAVEANRLANKLNYREGTAKALLFKAQYERMNNRRAQAQEMLDSAWVLAGKNASIRGWVLLEKSFHKNFNEKEPVYIESLRAFSKAKDQEGIAEVALWLAQDYALKGDYHKAFTYCDTSLTNALKPREHNIQWGHGLVLGAYREMSRLYETIGDLPTALDLLKRAQAYNRSLGNEDDMDDSIGLLYIKMNKLPEALQLLTKKVQTYPTNPFSKLFLAQAYVADHNYMAALQTLHGIEDTIIKRRLGIPTSNLLLHLAKAYDGTQQYDKALFYARRVFKAIPEIRLEAFKVASVAYGKLGKYDSAYLILTKYADMRDSILNSRMMLQLQQQLFEFRKRDAESKKEAAVALLQKNFEIQSVLLRQQELLQMRKDDQISLLTKDKELRDKQKKEDDLITQQKEYLLSILQKENKIKDQQLQKESLMKKGSLLILLLFLVAGFFYNRALGLKRKAALLAKQQAENKLQLQQLENHLKQQTLEQQAKDLEMQALRAQMNPHFIFNCLNSIDRFILKNETEAASDYLTQFARLIRQVLQNSQRPLITLQDELDMLQLYLEMEQLRFKESFRYTISFTKETDPNELMVPPLVLQPFCENSIWHGLMQKEGDRMLDIIMDVKDDVLQCRIMDNGIGIKKASMQKNRSEEKQRSYGFSITAKRLQLLNGDLIPHPVEIKDIVDDRGNIAGTTVTLYIKQFYSTEKVA